MLINQLQLLGAKRFLPLFLTQFLSAINNNLYKSALVVLIAYQLGMTTKVDMQVLLTGATGLFILPFFIFSALAGQLADKYEKSSLIRVAQLAEIGIVSLVGFAFYTQSTFLLLSVLFLLGLQATFLSPLKYAILPDQLEEGDWIAGNAWLIASTFIAILLGTLLGGVILSHAGVAVVSLVAIALAVLSFVTSLSIPANDAKAPTLNVNFNPLTAAQQLVNESFKSREMAIAILGISWFWLIVTTYISHFPAYAQNTLGASASVVTLLLASFTIGIGVGALGCHSLLKGKVHATYVPLAALGMSIFAIDLVIASRTYSVPMQTTLLSLSQFLSTFTSWRILVDLTLLAICAGVYVVPLYALLLRVSHANSRARVFAGNNMINACFMVAASLITSLMLLIHFSVTQVFLVIALTNLIAAIYICNLLPEEFVKSALIWVFKSFYRIEVRGMDNYHKAGERVLIIANHTSFLDAAAIAALLPDRLTFAIDTNVARKWWMSFFLKLVNTFSIDPTNPLATKSIIEYLSSNKRVVIFPEGRITVTGALMKIYEGPGLIADKANAKILPIRIDGAQYTPFSYLKGKVKLRWFPKITLTILEPRTFDLPDTLNSRERRKYIGDQLYDMMTDTMYRSSNINETLYESLLNAKSIHGGKHIIVEDIERKPMSYNRLILGSIVLGRYIARSSKRGEYIGILLPNSVANVVTFFGMQAHGRIPAMLNFSTGIQNILSACTMVKMKKVYTSHRFVQLAELQPVVDALTAHGVKVLYLEDVRQKIGIVRKLAGKLFALLPRSYYHHYNRIKKTNEKEEASRPAVVLFTSGSEGSPKGVVLSHRNLQANRFQSSARIDFTARDVVFNALPMFHSFGLNGATLLPIISGMRVFMYPSPLHYRIVPELCYDVGATVFFGTDTFLSNYAKYAHPYNFYSVRYVFAGAEKVREETRRVWMEKFGIRIFEGYGATEAAPVIATNTPMQYKSGTVGRLLPGIEYHLKPVEGIHDGARLCITGENVMLGYLHVHAPCEIVPPLHGWHDTGDIVAIDDEGFVTIKGRAKRFAKIAGEMISLTAIEEEIYALWPSHQHAVVSQPDDRKGEQITLVTSNKAAAQHEILTHFKRRGVAEIGMPRRIVLLAELPILNSGKIDYQAVLASLVPPSSEPEPEVG